MIAQGKFQLTGQRPGVWLKRGGTNELTRVRLFCFPPAGAGASVFRNWPTALPRTIEVCSIQPPGREARIREPASIPFSSAVDSIASEIAQLTGLPFAMFGHSLGGLLSFEVARLLCSNFGLSPVHLFLSVSRAPHAEKRLPPLHLLPDEEFTREIIQYGLLPQAVFEHPDLKAFLLSLFRADLAAYYNYCAPQGPPVDFPITVIRGALDRWMLASDVDCWRSQTQGDFSIKELPGGHHLAAETEPLLLQIISDALFETGE
jgi:medium-chain acyl-[acyl-carrier-protein] hydrolase